MKYIPNINDEVWYISTRPAKGIFHDSFIDKEIIDGLGFYKTEKECVAMFALLKQFVNNMQEDE